MRFLHNAILHTRSSAARHALRLRVARNTWSRFRGLMLAPPLQREPAAQGLLITRCPSVHGFFMRYAIDVVYLGTATPSTEGETRYAVTHTATLKPWRVSFGRNATAHALELPAGSIERWQIHVGDELRLAE
jgi:uncharacterized membrane protein (UPF0127 family)